MEDFLKSVAVELPALGLVVLLIVVFLRHLSSEAAARRIVDHERAMLNREGSAQLQSALTELRDEIRESTHVSRSLRSAFVRARGGSILEDPEHDRMTTMSDTEDDAQFEAGNSADTARMLAMDSGGIVAELEDAIRFAASKFLEAGSADLAQFSTRLSIQIALAHATGDVELARGVERQARLLAEVQRIRFTDASWEVFYGVIDRVAAVGFGVAVNLLTSGAVRVAP